MTSLSILDDIRRKHLLPFIKSGTFYVWYFIYMVSRNDTFQVDDRLCNKQQIRIFTIADNPCFRQKFPIEKDQYEGEWRNDLQINDIHLSFDNIRFTSEYAISNWFKFILLHKKISDKSLIVNIFVGNYITTYWYLYNTGPTTLYM